MPPPASAPSLPQELIEEIFLRLPPDEPAWLVRASLANKLWLGLLSGSVFRGRYHEFHGSPPMLGFVYFPSSDPVPPLVSTTKFGARYPDNWGSRKYSAWDCRHGRVLLQHEDVPSQRFFVWDPMTGRRKDVYDLSYCSSLGAAVLCAVSGCDHHACHEGPFRVVFVSLNETHGGCIAHVSFPEPCEWTKPCSHLQMWRESSSGLHLASHDAFIETVPPVLIQDALYFMLGYEHDEHVEILKYDMSSNCLSLHSAPPAIAGASIHMAMEDGSLGFAHVDGLTLNMWSRQMGSDKIASWTQHRVIDLKKLIPIQNPEKGAQLAGSVEGSDFIFVITDLGVYMINLKSLQWKKIWKIDTFCCLIPYMSFYNPPERVSHLLQHIGNAYLDMHKERTPRYDHLEVTRLVFQ
uniref:Uncharacterized protein n=1 Tax=Avena sativa TaxID=4498 RepID=A0ACD5WHN7_AVESA